MADTMTDDDCSQTGMNYVPRYRDDGGITGDTDTDDGTHQTSSILNSRVKRSYTEVTRSGTGSRKARANFVGNTPQKMKPTGVNFNKPLAVKSPSREAYALGRRDSTSQRGSHSRSKGGSTSILGNTTRTSAGAGVGPDSDGNANKRTRILGLIGALPKDKPTGLTERIPMTAVVVISCNSEDALYAEALKRARENISLKELGISNKTKVRRAASGGIIIEVSGDDRNSSANKLADIMRKVLNDYPMRISRPVRLSELLIGGFDDSVGAAEIQCILTKAGDYCEDDIRMGPLRRLRNGLCSVWVKCPTELATRLLDDGKVRLGWTNAQVLLLQPRPLRCYRCMAIGHIKTTATK